MGFGLFLSAAAQFQQTDIGIVAGLSAPAIVFLFLLQRLLKQPFSPLQFAPTHKNQTQQAVSIGYVKTGRMTAGFLNYPAQNRFGLFIFFTGIPGLRLKIQAFETS